MILAELPLLLIEHSLVVGTVIEFIVGLLVALNRDALLPERSSAVELPDKLLLGDQLGSKPSFAAHFSEVLSEQYVFHPDRPHVLLLILR